jgi:hypothetical protein
MRDMRCITPAPPTRLTAVNKQFTGSLQRKRRDASHLYEGGRFSALSLLTRTQYNIP